MCGIVYCKDFRGRDVVPKVKSRFKAQRHRGTDGFGYYIPSSNRLTHNPNEKRLLNNMMRQSASEVLFHHRFPTSTENVQNACHPFSTKGELFKHNYVMVHNGWLTNEYDLQEEHEKLGIRYVSTQANGRFNDSEALLYDLALYLEGKQDKLQARGAIAFVVIERDETGKPVKLHYGRNSSSPLKLKLKTNKFMSLTSEGDGADILPHQLHTYDYITGEFSQKYLEIPGPATKAYSYTGKSWADDDDYGFSTKPSVWDRTRDYTDEEWTQYAMGATHADIMAGRRLNPSIPALPAPSARAPLSDLLNPIPSPMSSATEATEVHVTVQPAKAGGFEPIMTTSIREAAVDMVEDELTKAGEDLEAATDAVELMVIESNNRLLVMRENLNKLAEAGEDSTANIYLSLTKEITNVVREVKIREEALWQLLLIAENELEGTLGDPATEERLMQLVSGDKP